MEANQLYRVNGAVRGAARGLEEEDEELMEGLNSAGLLMVMTRVMMDCLCCTVACPRRALSWRRAEADGGRLELATQLPLHIFSSAPRPQDDVWGGG